MISALKRRWKTVRRKDTFRIIAEPLDRERLLQVLKTLGEELNSKGRIYLTGGATALYYGWRDMTVDLDLQAIPEPPKFYEVISRVKDTADVNIELVTPDHFVPLLAGWETRSKYIETYGKTDFYHFDPYMQALSKIERDHPRDQHDVAEMIKANYVDPILLLDLFQEVKAQCLKFPAIDADIIENDIKKLIS